MKSASDLLFHVPGDQITVQLRRILFYLDELLSDGAHQLVEQKPYLWANRIEGFIVLRALVIARVAFDGLGQTDHRLFVISQQRSDERSLVMSLGQFRVEFNGLPQMLQSRLQPSVNYANYSCEVMSLSRPREIAGPRVFGGLEEILQRLREVDDVVEVYLRDRTMDRVIGVVALFGFKKISERLFVPAVPVSPLGACAIGPGLALELGQANLFEDARERFTLHLQTPDEVAQQQIEIGLETLQTARQPFNSQRQSDGVLARAAQALRIQSAEPRFDRDLMISRRQADRQIAGFVA